MEKVRSLPRRMAGLVLSVILGIQAAAAAELSLAVADSTCEAMQKTGALYEARHAVRINTLCKSSGLLAKGLRGGVLEADIFVSADREWMDFAIQHGLVSPEQVSSPWGNDLVVAAARNSVIRLENWRELTSGKVARILIGDPGTAPFGRYAKQALETSGLWDQVRAKIETRKNISLLADSLAGADAATVGILFKTQLNEQLRQILPVDKSWHPPIRYYVAPLRTASSRAEADRFLKFLLSPPARAVFRAEGFDVTPQ